MMSSKNNVIIDQPQIGAAAPFASAEEIPTGLDPLIGSDYLRIKQKIELCECCSGCETKNRYQIFTPQGAKLFEAKESSFCMCRWCCEAKRGFKIRIRDNSDREVLLFQRKCTCQPCCLPCCCLQELKVLSGSGDILGTVKQECTCCRPHFTILDAEDEKVLEIKGPCRTCTCGPCGFCCRTVGFDIIGSDGKQIGMIRKEYSGAAKELMTDADNFYVTFPRNLDVKVKATLFGAVFLIDFMYFESHSDDT